MENLIKPILHNTSSIIDIYWDFIGELSKYSIYAKMDVGYIEINLIYVFDLQYLGDELNWLFDEEERCKTFIVYEKQIKE